jgi:hypothetical protein
VSTCRHLLNDVCCRDSDAVVEGWVLTAAFPEANRTLLTHGMSHLCGRARPRSSAGAAAGQRAKAVFVSGPVVRRGRTNLKAQNVAIRPLAHGHALACGRLIRLMTATVIAIAGCVYDSDERCGDERVLDGGACVCRTGTVSIDGSCIKQVAAPNGLGDACSTAMECTSDEFSKCQIARDDTGYCTKTNCEIDRDCGGDYYCSKAASPTFCKRMPTGQGAPCTSDDDCKEFDASYCAIVGGKCAVANCTADTDCAPGFKCQDYSAFGLPKLCAP